MTGVSHSPVVHRKFLYELNVLETVVPGLGPDRQLSTNPDVQNSFLNFWYVMKVAV